MTRQQFQPVGIIAGGQEAANLDARLYATILPEQIQRDPPQDREVFRRIASTHVGLIFTKGDVE